MPRITLALTERPIPEYRGEPAFTGGGNPRTFSGCSITLPNPPPPSTGSSGYSVCMVNAGENIAAGTALGQFYNQWRILNNDKFLIGSVA